MSSKSGAGAEPIRISARQMEMVAIRDLIPYEGNARLHTPQQIDKLVESLREFGFVAPVLIDDKNRVLAGHGRLEAAEAAGMETVPCVRASGLTDAQRRAYILADNRLCELGEWDQEALEIELDGLASMDFNCWFLGFDLTSEPQQVPHDGSAAARIETESTPEYEAFVEKFKPKLTTDDCFTPPHIYEAVKSWAVQEYGLSGRPILRPFYPGGDYQAETYPKNCVVIDNPPFSIQAEILDFYQARHIDFFLFGHALTLFSACSGRLNYLPLQYPVVYENGAKVPTSFVTNLGEWKIDTAPELYASLEEADQKAKSSKADLGLPVYSYPNEVVSSAIIGAISKRRIPLRIRAESVSFIRTLDSQRDAGVSIFGAGFLLSEAAAAEKAAAEKAAAEKAAEKAAAHVWVLSEREREIIRSLK